MTHHYPPQSFTIEHRSARYVGEREVNGMTMTVRSVYGERSGSLLGYQADLRELQAKLLGEIIDQWQSCQP